MASRITGTETMINRSVKLSTYTTNWLNSARKKIIILGFRREIRNPSRADSNNVLFFPAAILSDNPPLERNEQQPKYAKYAAPEYAMVLKNIGEFLRAIANPASESTAYIPTPIA
nr:hypothetical protein BCU50_15410 [Vibrio sp. 10N.286.46.E10]